MKTQLYTQRVSTTLLVIINILERFCYYGLRSIIILYAVYETGLGLHSDTALSHYSNFTTVGAAIPIFLGLLSDFIFKQKKSVMLGATITLLGCILLLISQHLLVAGLAIGLILCGTSLVKINLTVLVGRLFDKKDQNRDFAFLAYYFSSNIGSFLGVLIIGFIADTYNFTSGFALISLFVLIYLLLFQFINDRLNLLEEKNNQQEEEEDEIKDGDVLDAHLVKKSTYFDVKSKFNLLIIGVIILVCSFFRFGENITDSNISRILNSQKEIYLFGTEISSHWTHGISAIWTIILLIILISYWSKREIGSTIKKIAIAGFLTSLAIFLSSYINTISVQRLVDFALLPFCLISLAEILLLPFAMSAITRLSPVKYSSTIYGTYLSSLWLFAVLSDFLYDKVTDEKYLIITSIGILIGVLWIFYRKDITLRTGILN